MSQTLDRPQVSSRSADLGRLTHALVAVVRDRGGVMPTRDALVALARQEGIPLSRLNYVLTLAKAEGRVTTESATSTIHVD